MTVEELLTDDHLTALAAAEERGVDIHIGDTSEEVQTRIQDHVPSANSLETM